MSYSVFCANTIVQGTGGGVGVNGPLFIFFTQNRGYSNFFGTVEFTLNLSRFTGILLTGLILP